MWIRSSFCDAGHCLEVRWRKSTFSGESACLEAVTVGDHQVVLRNSSRPDLAPMPFSPQEWNWFLSWVKDPEGREDLWPTYIGHLMPTAEECMAFALGVRAGEFDISGH